MCGIVALIGSREAAPLLLEGLRQLEYRGYDSAGIATVHAPDGEASGALTCLQQARAPRAAAPDHAQLVAVVRELHADRRKPRNGIGATIHERAQQRGLGILMPRREGVLEVVVCGVVRPDACLNTSLCAAGVARTEGGLGDHEDVGTRVARGRRRARRPSAP